MLPADDPFAVRVFARRAALLGRIGQRPTGVARGPEPGEQRGAPRRILCIRRGTLSPTAQSASTTLHPRQCGLQRFRQQEALRVGAQHLRRLEQGTDPQESHAAEHQWRTLSIVSIVAVIEPHHLI